MTLELNEFIDPFVMQLFIVPLIVIGLGILISILAKKIIVAPLITLLLNLLYETWYMKNYYPEHELSFTSWNIIFPLISLMISLVVVSALKQKNNLN